MNQNRYGLLLLTLCIILHSSAMALDVSQMNDTLSENTGEIPVGILVMQSGFVSDIGLEYQRAFEFALNDHPDSPILPVIMDAGSNASVAASAWHNLTTMVPDLPVVITVASWTTNVVYPDAADSERTQLALGSAVINRSRPSDHLIRFTPGVEQESPVLASYLKQYSRIAMLGGDNDYSRGYITALESLLPDKILFEEFYNPDDLQSTLNITNVTAFSPDVIVLLSVSEAGSVAETIRNIGLTVPLIGTRVIERNSLLETEAVDGLIFTVPALNRTHPFFSRYLDEYGEEATFYGAEGFDAMTTLFSAIDECGNTSECISSWYQNRTYNGTLGTIRFDESGVAYYPIEFKVIKDGKFENYSFLS